MSVEPLSTMPAGRPALPRMIAVWCPDWPVTAAVIGAGIAEDRPAAVLIGNRIVGTNHAARQRGVQRGQRKREAEYRCPDLAVLARDLDAEARQFEAVVSALETVAAGVEITRPGLAAINARGPSGYYGGESAALAAMSRAVVATPAAGVMVGVADGAFAAALAARTGVIVPPGDSPRFLAPLPITTFGPASESALVDVLTRLGIRTLGDFATLPAQDVAARFGPLGFWMRTGGQWCSPTVPRSAPHRPR